MRYDYIIIGGGIIGLATARQLKLALPDASILLLEQEQQFAHHQTGRNSGVIHAGVYYAPGSLKARFCKEGVDATLAFCRLHQIPFEQCGKLLVATNRTELQRMDALLQRCRQNHIDAQPLNSAQLHQLEPRISGLGAIQVKATGIVDYRLVSEALAQEFQSLGGEYRLQSRVTALREEHQEIHVTTRQGEYRCRHLIACAGLQADRIARLLNLPLDFQIIPFRGEYYQLPGSMNDLVKHLIYPIPDPNLPFLGVHLTRMIDSSITVGPNALLGWKREGYATFNFSLRDSLEMLRFPGFWRNLGGNLRPGLLELKNAWFKRGYLKLVQKYCPQIQLQDLLPYPTGIRAQAVMRDGSMVHDFLFCESPRSLHVCNAPSPAATSAIPIAKHITAKVLSRQN
mgnify:CR=1 FL=1